MGDFFVIVDIYLNNSVKRICNRLESVQLDGNEYEPAPIEVVLPDKVAVGEKAYAHIRSSDEVLNQIDEGMTKISIIEGTEIVVGPFELTDKFKTDNSIKCTLSKK